MLSQECRLPESQVILKRLWTVIKNPDSADQLDRQLILLGTYFAVTGDRVSVEDLRLVASVITFLRPRAECNSRYKEPLQKMLHLLEHPPVMERSSDEIRFGHYAVELFDALGTILLEAKKVPLKLQVLRILQSFLVTERSAKPNTLPLRACVKGIELSDFVECVGDLMAIIDESGYHQTVYTALTICQLSSLSCWKLLMKNTLESLLVRLTTIPDRLKPAVMDTTCELLWKLLKCPSDPKDWNHVPIPSSLALRSLRYVLREEALVHAHPGRDAGSLNNISAIILKIIHLFPNADYVQTGLIEDVAFFATLTEFTRNLKIVPYFKDKSDHLQFTKIMLACLAVCPVSSLSAVVFTRCQLPHCLVKMIDNCIIENGSENYWCYKSLIEIFQCVLPVVLALFDYLREAFLNAGLMRKLVMFLNVNYIQKKNVPVDVAIMILKTLFSLCSREQNSKTVENLRNSEAVPVLLQLCNSLIGEDSPLTSDTQSMLFHGLYVLSILMANQKDVQIEHSTVSLCIVESVYRRIIKPLSTDSLVDNRFVVGVSNFAWEVIVLNHQNVFRFLNGGMVFLHIDIMEKSDFSVQLTYLSMLVDLCEYERCVPYLVTWRGPDGIKLLSVLCRIWRCEEERLRVPKGNNGCISDTERPLMGEDQYETMKANKNRIISSCDVFGSARPKIYAIVQLLHRHKEVVELCEETYRLGHDSVPHEDQITLKLIEAYLPLKMGEIWWEIKHKQEDVVPLDRYLADTLSDRYLDRSLNVQRAQLDLSRAREKLQRVEEQQYYRTMKDCRLTAALAALQEVVRVARSSDRQQLVLAHRKFRDDIEASRALMDTNLRVAHPPDASLIIVNNKTHRSTHKELSLSEVHLSV